MTESKFTYAPDYVSAATLAHRLDCSESTIHSYVRRGLLPPPVKIGELVRWSWIRVARRIESLETGTEEPHDPYLAGIENAAPEKARH